MFVSKCPTMPSPCTLERFMWHLCEMAEQLLDVINFSRDTQQSSSSTIRIFLNFPDNYFFDDLVHTKPVHFVFRKQFI